MFKSTMNKGFQMDFENGLTISVQFGNGNYCSNKFRKDISLEGYSANEITVCKDAEITCWNKDNNETKCKGWVNSNEVAKVIYSVSIAKNIDEIQNLFV